MPRSYEEKYEKNIGLGALLSNRFNDLKGEIKVQLPCRVTSVDYTTNSVDVAILDYDHNPSGELVNYPILPNVPIRQPMYSGSAYLILPVRVGDIGTIEFFDSSVDDILETGSYDFDYSEKWHDINYGLFTNGFLPKSNVVQIDANSSIVMATHSKTFVFTVDNSGNLIVTTPTMTLNGNLVVNGNISTTGSVTATGEVTGNSKALSTHTHKDSMGGATTPPQ